MTKEDLNNWIDNLIDFDKTNYNLSIYKDPNNPTTNIMTKENWNDWIFKLIDFYNKESREIDNKKYELKVDFDNSNPNLSIYKDPNIKVTNPTKTIKILDI
jgi:hypothetical protein